MNCDIKTDHPFDISLPDLVIVNKKQRNYPLHRSGTSQWGKKNQRKRKTRQILEPLENERSYGTWRWQWY